MSEQYEPIIKKADALLTGLGRGALISTPGVVFGLSIGLAYNTSNEVAAAIFLVTTAFVWYANRGER